MQAVCVLSALHSGAPAALPPYSPPVVAALPAEGCVHFKVVAGGDLDAGYSSLKALRPGPEHRPVVLLPLLADHPRRHVAHLMGQGGAQASLVVYNLEGSQWGVA